MANPRHKTPKRKKRSRRSHHALRSAAGATCPRCHADKMPHRVCDNCGHYNERQVVEVKGF